MLVIDELSNVCVDNCLHTAPIFTFLQVFADGVYILARRLNHFFMKVKKHGNSPGKCYPWLFDVLVFLIESYFINKMKKKHLLFVAALIGSFAANAQTKIGGTAGPSNPAAFLEIGDSTGAVRGILMPRVALAATNLSTPLAAHVPGMFVYNTATAGNGITAVAPGNYYNDGTHWIRLSDIGNSNPNSVTGRALTSSNGIILSGTPGASLLQNVDMRLDSMAIAKMITIGGPVSDSIINYINRQIINNNVVGNNVTAGSNKVKLGGTPAGAALKPFSIDVNQSNLRLDSIGGKISLTQITNGGATNNQTLVWNTTLNQWVPTDPAPVQTEWFLNGTGNDAGGDKTATVYRKGAIMPSQLQFYKNGNGTPYTNAWIGAANFFWPGNKEALHIGGVTDASDNVRRTALYADQIAAVGKLAVSSGGPFEATSQFTVKGGSGLSVDAGSLPGLAFNRDVKTGAIYNTSMPAFQLYQSTNNLQFQVYNGNGSSVTPNALAVASNGYVGVGTTTPKYQLQVQKNSANPALMIGGGYPGGPRIQTYGLDADPNAWMGLGTDMGGGPYEHSIYFPSAGPGKLTIGNYNGSTYNTRMTVLANGNVGIGTSTPGFQLHVANGNIGISGGNPRLYMSANGYSNRVMDVNTNGNWRLYREGGPEGTMVFMEIAPNGNVGIGNSAPAAKLSVVGKTQIADGTQCAGCVFTSDANGVGSWVKGGDQNNGTGIFHSTVAQTFNRYNITTLQTSQPIKLAYGGNYLVSLRWWGKTDGPNNSTDNQVSAYIYVYKNGVQMDGIEYYSVAGSGIGSVPGAVVTFTVNLMAQNCNPGDVLTIGIQPQVGVGGTSAATGRWYTGRAGVQNVWMPSVIVSKQ